MKNTIHPIRSLEDQSICPPDRIEIRNRRDQVANNSRNAVSSSHNLSSAQSISVPCQILIARSFWHRRSYFLQQMLLVVMYASKVLGRVWPRVRGTGRLSLHTFRLLFVIYVEVTKVSRDYQSFDVRELALT